MKAYTKIDQILQLQRRILVLLKRKTKRRDGRAAVEACEISIHAIMANRKSYPAVAIYHELRARGFENRNVIRSARNNAGIELNRRGIFWEWVKK